MSTDQGENKEFKVEVITEGGLATLFLGSSKIPIRKVEQVLNQYGAQGWDLAFMVVEQHRYLLFWTREAVVITMSRPIHSK